MVRFGNRHTSGAVTSMEDDDERRDVDVLGANYLEFVEFPTKESMNPHKLNENL